MTAPEIMGVEYIRIQLCVLQAESISSEQNVSAAKELALLRCWLHVTLPSAADLV